MRKLPKKLFVNQDCYDEKDKETVRAEIGISNMKYEGSEVGIYVLKEVRRFKIVEIKQ